MKDMIIKTKEEVRNLSTWQRKDYFRDLMAYYGNLVKEGHVEFIEDLEVATDEYYFADEVMKGYAS